MGLKLTGSPANFSASDFQHLNNYCESVNLNVELIWERGQFSLSSDIENENPISIQIDSELNRHGEYFKKNSVYKELLARALGIKTSQRPKVIDLTGGLLGDTLLFLSFGCEVTTIERNPIVSTLIQSAVNNSKHDLTKHLKFSAQDSKSFLKGVSNPEVIFFDPMFEDPNAKALPKKEMRIFRSFVGSDQDALEVFEKAWQCRPKRLVVKRPKHSIELHPKPDIVYTGKATRYDVYLPQNHGSFVSNQLKSKL